MTVAALPSVRVRGGGAQVQRHVFSRGDRLWPVLLLQRHAGERHVQVGKCLEGLLCYYTLLLYSLGKDKGTGRNRVALFNKKQRHMKRCRMICFIDRPKFYYMKTCHTFKRKPVGRMVFTKSARKSGRNS